MDEACRKVHVVVPRKQYTTVISGDDDDDDDDDIFEMTAEASTNFNWNHLICLGVLQ